jgi:uncharacterized protein (DUF1330 family)
MNLGHGSLAVSIIDTARNCANYMKLVSHSPHGIRRRRLRLVRVWKAFGRGNYMNKGYWVVAYRKVPDMATVKNYAALLLPVLEKFGGRMLVSPTSVVAAQEAGFEQMTIVVEFDSYEIALSTYKSDDHKKALAALGPGVERDFRIAEGV